MSEPGIEYKLTCQCGKTHCKSVSLQTKASVFVCARCWRIWTLSISGERVSVDSLENERKPEQTNDSWQDMPTMLSVPKHASGFWKDWRAVQSANNAQWHHMEAGYE